MNMKKKILFFSIVLLISACQIDNYDAPDAILTGRVIDNVTGKQLLTEQPNGFQIRNKELSWSGMDIQEDNPEQYAQYFWGKADGSFRNAKMFAGTYQITPSNGPFHLADAAMQTVELSPGKETDLTFHVTPYISFSDVSIEKDPSASNGIVATFTIRTHPTEGEPATFKNYRIFATNRTALVGNNAYDEGVSSAIDETLTAAQLAELEACNSVTITKKTKGFVKEKKYAIRIGARCKETPKERYNLSEVIFLDF
ncbi:MAG: DUF3823 domain-containing protein [Bacteroidales bacterium]|jgi:hypothetical protein|nr:DUF3823 domain-containing protein [Bacteroidales bacterium]